MRDRDQSPSIGGQTNLNNGNSSYRSNSPDLDSPRDSRDRDRSGGERSDRYQSSSYIQKMKDRDRDRDYKKDKYTGNVSAAGQWFPFMFVLGESESNFYPLSLQINVIDVAKETLNIVLILRTMIGFVTTEVRTRKLST